MKPGDLVLFFHPFYSQSRIIGIILSGPEGEGITYTILDLRGEIKKIHTTVWPDHEVLSSV